MQLMLHTSRPTRQLPTSMSCNATCTCVDIQAVQRWLKQKQALQESRTPQLFTPPSLTIAANHGSSLVCFLTLPPLPLNATEPFRRLIVPRTYRLCFAQIPSVCVTVPILWHFVLSRYNRMVKAVEVCCAVLSCFIGTHECQSAAEEDAGCQGKKADSEGHVCRRRP